MVNWRILNYWWISDQTDIGIRKIGLVRELVNLGGIFCTNQRTSIVMTTLTIHLLVLLIKPFVQMPTPSRRLMLAICNHQADWTFYLGLLSDFGTIGQSMMLIMTLNVLSETRCQYVMKQHQTFIFNSAYSRGLDVLVGLWCLDLLTFSALNSFVNIY